MDNKKQTAVDFLVKEFSEILGKIETEGIQDLLLADAITRAKRIEKQQIVEACNLPKDKRWYDASKFDNCGQQYYNETYAD